MNSYGSQLALVPHSPRLILSDLSFCRILFIPDSCYDVPASVSNLEGILEVFPEASGSDTNADVLYWSRDCALEYVSPVQ